MQKTSTALLVTMVLSMVSLWGCSHQNAGATNAKIRELENRHAKLEEDYRVILAANEANRRKLSQLETQRAELTQKIEELQAVVKERDELKVQLATRTEERDELKTQLTTRTEERDTALGNLMQFSKDLVSLAGRVEAAASRPAGNALIAVPASRKSE